MEFLNKEQRRAILKEYNVTTANDINRALKDMFGSLLQEALEAELDTELQYPKNGSIPPDKSNRRNGHTQKTVRSDRGELALSVPRDREGEFEPIIIKKHQKEVSGIEEQILTLYAKGVSVREIQDYLNRLYGVDVSPTLISNVTNRIVPIMHKIIKMDQGSHIIRPGFAYHATSGRTLSGQRSTP